MEIAAVEKEKYMPNTILTPQIIANEALMVLENNLAMAGLIHRDYSKEFVKVGDTITVRKPAKFVAKNFTGTTSAQDITEGSVAVKMDRFRDVTVNVSSKELTLDIKDFSAQVVEPAIQAIAQAVDKDILAVAVQKAGKTVTGTASPTNLADIADMAKFLDLNGAPTQNRSAILHPTHKYRYALTDNLSKVSYAGDSKTLRDAELGGLYSFNTFMSQNCPDTLAATAGTATAYKVTATKGATKVNLASVSPATGTVKTGDAFIIDGYMYTITGDFTATSSAVSNVTIDQPIHADFTTTDAYLVNTTHSVGIHRNSIALVTRQLEIPLGASNAAIASANGLAVRVVYDYNSATKQDSISFDIIYGIKELDTNLIAQIKG